jgi:lipopolysaccharide transport system ATP-binding protein
MSSIITVSNVSKVYRIGKKADRADSFVGMLQSSLTAPFRNWRAMHQPMKADQETEEDLHWALRDVSFEVKEGEVLGIIGRNGAGKSTLLKILSRITEPTSGEVRIKGRVASLLEVGTGFHPDLTGRDNTYLNGTILGMSKREIDRLFDEIVDFSGVEKFLDTPVKRYSSGMKVRLAFAVAAYLEPEILIIDEVLAVGDAEFQKKCMGKMGQVAKGGRTVIFVSHNMNAITSLCSSGIVLKDGRVNFTGVIPEAIVAYGASTDVADSIELGSLNEKSLLKRLTIRQDNKLTEGILEPIREVAIDFEFHSKEIMLKPRIGVAFNNSKGDRVFAVASWLGPTPLPPLIGNRCVRFTFEMPPLVPGRYTVDTGLYDLDSNFTEEYYSSGAIEVSESNYLQTTEPFVSEIGQICVRSKWTLV